MTYDFLQQYWWVIISLLGGLVVFLMFVQGANSQLLCLGRNEAHRSMLVNSTGRKWELMFTTLVLFGGAFFASFPLFYSTSFSGAYWVWMLILLTFVFQAVSYEFQNKNGNLLGSKAFVTFLVINGVLAPFLIGTAVGTFFTGSDFLVNKEAIIGPDRIISVWGNSWHGLEALAQPFAVLLGVVVLLLDISLGMLYALNNIDDPEFENTLRRKLRIYGTAFVLLFVVWAVLLMLRPGFAVDADGTVFMENNKYLHNFVQMPAVLCAFLAGVVLVLAGLYTGMFTKSKRGIWFAGIGSVLAVMGVFLTAGLGATAYYPSVTNLQSSLTLANSSSSEFTLKTMFWVSMIIPFVLAYIVYVWRAMDRKAITKQEIESTDLKY